MQAKYTPAQAAIMGLRAMGWSDERIAKKRGVRLRSIAITMAYVPRTGGKRGRPRTVKP